MAVKCKILNLTYLNQKTLCVSLEAQTKFDFLAGQYVNLDLGASGKLPFSIASMPSESGRFELHFGGISPHSGLANSVQFLEQHYNYGEFVEVEQAKGHAWLRSTEQEIVLVAGGSGYTYTRSLLQEALKRNPGCKITLYWGCYSEDDLYEHDYLIKLAQSNARFNYIPVVEVPATNVTAYEGRLLSVVYEQFDFTAQPDLYLCGRYEMVQSAYSYFNNEYQGRLNIYSDALPAA